MSEKIASSSPTVDPYEFLQLVQNPDGTITRNIKYFSTAVATDPVHHPLVLSKDVPINQSNNTGARIFLARQALDSSTSSTLPLIVYIHGGGFILGNVESSMFHDFCSNMAAEFPAVVVSVKYRLAPEHRLPAAYDDAMEALHWIKSTQEAWLKKYVDFSSCYLMGSSAGGNIAFHVGLRAAAQKVDNLLPMQIKGLILHQPFFGGVERTESELRLMNNQYFPVCVADLMWELALPRGADRDHEYCNPRMVLGIGGESEPSDILRKIRLLGWKVLITGWDGDPLFDRQIELVKILEQKGVQVKGHFGEGGCHGTEMFDPAKGKALLFVFKNLVLGEDQV